MSVNFNALTTEQEEFLISFIKHRGDIDEVVKDVSIPVTGYMSERYAANLMWLDIQKTLGIPNENYKYFTPDWPYTTKKKPKASDIVRAYYYADCLNYNERDHFAYSPVLRINLAGYDYRCYKDHIMCKKRLSYNECEDMTEEYRYDVLDLITNTLIEHMGTCQKGSQTGKNAYAVGTIAYCYKTKILDKMQYPSTAGKLPVYYSILEAAGILYNDTQTLQLTDEFLALL